MLLGRLHVAEQMTSVGSQHSAFVTLETIKILDSNGKWISKQCSVGEGHSASSASSLWIGRILFAVGKTILDASDRKRLHAAGKLMGQRLPAVTQQEELLKEMLDRRQSYCEEKLMMENRIALLDMMIDQENTKVRGGENQLLTLKRAVDVAEDQVDALSKKMPRQMHAPSVD